MGVGKYLIPFAFWRFSLTFIWQVNVFLHRGFFTCMRLLLVAGKGYWQICILLTILEKTLRTQRFFALCLAANAQNSLGVGVDK